ncbi:MAG: class I SAM-dependent methyltransferase [Candidatus Jordarchaeum sp.]|uniref:class I SAM-dependent methyltransferase n=1 Tax=Candidatus Jordarchaeum sp. TaxID=2823881 RepID=UPI004049A046
MGKPSWKRLKKFLETIIPAELLDLVPRSWQLLGDILICNIKSELLPFEREIGIAFTKIEKRARIVARKVMPPHGDMRIPNLKIIAGGGSTETIHRENHCVFKLDPFKILFSPGNSYERFRLSQLVREGEIIIDLFSCVGQFSIPIAVHSKPSKVYAIEINPCAYKYLATNILLNRVVDVVKPILGNCVDVAPVGIADRVIMGLINGTEKYLDTAFNSLRREGGIINYHEAFPKRLLQEKLKNIEKKVEQRSFKIKHLDFKKVKKYAPSIDHIVFDLEVRK